MGSMVTQRPSSVPAVKRGRGRPPRTPQETQAVRDQIKQAAIQVYAAHGYHAVTVELILQACGLSRPTFYRYFDNTAAVLDLVLKEANDLLIHDVTTAIRSQSDAMAKVQAGLLAWRGWGEKIGPLLQAIYADMHAPQTLAFAHRQRVLAALTREINASNQALGRPPIHPVRLETFVMGMEFLGYRFHFGPEGPTDAMWEETRQAMLRLALGLLGSRMEWGMATSLADFLHIKLDD